MTQFQLFSLGLFLALAAAAYRTELLRAIKTLSSFRPAVAHTVEAVQPSIAVLLVNDIINVTELRDKLAARGCKDGVAACTALLRVIVESEQPTKSVTVA
jgi:hypothetical protein